MSNILTRCGVFYFFIYTQCSKKTYFFGDSFYSLYIYWDLYGVYSINITFYKSDSFQNTKAFKLVIKKNFKYKKFYDIKCWTKVKILIVEYSKENCKSGRNSKRSWKRHVIKFRINVPFSK